MPRLAAVTTCSKRWLACLVVLCACDHGYTIDGKVVVARGAPRDAAAPAVLCVGHGGPLASSGVYGGPAYRAPSSPDMTLFCGPAPEDVEFSLHETIIYGSMPRRAHVYAWLAPIPAAKQLCAERKTAVLAVDAKTLDGLMSPEDANQASGARPLNSSLCGRDPTPDLPMAYAVTFDPDHETWSKAPGGLVEHRDLRIE